MSTPARPQLLIVAGLDPSGGAGLIADVRHAAELGARPLAVATALTEQNTRGAVASNPVDPEIVGAQLRALLTDIELAAVKIGMIGSSALAEMVGRELELTAAPVVWDPVLIASRGCDLFTGDLAAAIDALLPHTTLLTPNIAEASALAEIEIHDVETAIRAGEILCRRGFANVLVKGGHLPLGSGARAHATGDAAAHPGPDAAANPGSDVVTDVLVSSRGVEHFAQPRRPLVGGANTGLGPRQHGSGVHGTGCALSTAIAVGLAEKRPLPVAVAQAKAWLAQRLAAPVVCGQGRPSIA